jgi:Protein of unknown function (DUF4232)
MNRASRSLRLLILATTVSAATVAGVLPAFAASSQVPGGYAMCRAGQLSVSVPGGPAPDGPNAAMGTLTWNIVFRNHSTETCSLSGWPGVTAQYRGKTVSLKVSDTDGNHLAEVRARPVTLAEGARAVTTVMMSDNTTGCASPWILGVRLPHSTDSDALKQPADGFGLCGGGQIALSPIYPLGTLLGTLKADRAVPKTEGRRAAACDLERISVTTPSATDGVGLISLRNTGRKACSLPAYWPTVRLHSASGSAEMARDFAATAAISAVRPYLAGYRVPGTPQVLTLQPAATASVVLASAGAAAGTCQEITSASLYSTAIALGMARTVQFGHPVTICGQPQLLPYLASTPSAPALRTVQAAAVGQKSQTPENDSPAGFWYGTDSNGPTAVGKGPYYEPDPDASSGENGHYGWYGGGVGTYAHWYGCTANLFYSVDWNGKDYSAAETNYYDYAYGVGASPYWQMAGPGRDPNYNGTSTEAFDWGRAQAIRVLSKDLGDAFSAPYLIMDIESSYYNGWRAIWNGPCGTDEKSTNSVSPTLDRQTFNGFWDTIREESGYSPSVYCAGGPGDSSWNAMFGSDNNIPGTPEWTYANETGSLDSFPSRWSVGDVSAEFFGGQTTSSANADFWQWSGGDGSRNGNAGDFDQVDGNRM